MKQLKNARENEGVIKMGSCVQGSSEYHIE